MNKFKKIVAVGLGVVLLGATLTGCVGQPKITQVDLDNAKVEAYGKGRNSVNVDLIRLDAINSVNITRDNADVIAQATVDKDAEIARLNQVIADAEEVEREVEIETNVLGYDIDKLKIGAEFNATLSDRQIESLFDGEVDFDGDDYDAKETLTITDFKFAANDEDYNEDVYLNIPKKSIEYCMTFEDTLNTSEIDEDETLKFNLLGTAIEVISWEDTELTMKTGTILPVNESKTYDINGENIFVKSIGSDNSAPYVYLTIEGDTLKLYEGDTGTIGNAEIYAKEVVVDEDGPDFATLEVGEEVEVNIDHNDEYSKDSLWDYKINKNSICITNNEDFTELDDNEDYKAIATGEDVCLPNNYVCLNNNGLSEEDSAEYSFELEEEDGIKYVLVKGDFVKDLNSYDDGIYVNASGFYEDDKGMALIDNVSVNLGDSDLTLTWNGVNLTISDITTNLNLNLLKVAGKDLIQWNDNYRTTFGIIIDSPEDNIDDYQIEIIVPEEELEASITVVSK